MFRVKMQLFRLNHTVCAFMVLLCGAVIRSELETANKFKSAYNKCLKIFFGYNRRYSVSQLRLEAGLPSWNTLIINSRTVFAMQNCQNGLVSQLCMLGL